jgi:two-component system sensor histidine kinase/response regulator
MNSKQQRTWEISSVITVIDGGAYRNVRLKVQQALQSLAVPETLRALAVADFSLLYRNLPDGQQLKIVLRSEGPCVALRLQCQTNHDVAERIKQQILHLDFEKEPLDHGSTNLNVRLCGSYPLRNAINLEQAEAWLQESTTEEVQLRALQTEEANAAKREFLSRMSHELRTPMNAIIGMTHLALRTDLDARQRDYLVKIRSAGENLLGIINDVLDFSKIEAGKITLETIPFRLEKVMGDAANLVADKVFGKGVELLFHVDEQVPDNLIGDPLRLTQVLLNLLSNAAKFTEQGQITLRVSEEGRQADEVDLVFAVQDSGIGMSEEQMANLFQAFNQADVSTTRRYGGTGLGLSICQRLLELMGGSIQVSSRPGQGSCFQARARFGIGEKCLPQVVPTALNRLRVLVVDDNPVACEVACGLLGHLHIPCETTSSGEQGMVLLEEAHQRGEPFDLLLLDWQLGEGIDGLSLARTLRQRGDIQQPRIVLVTAYGRGDAQQQEDAAAVDAWLSKPIHPSDLIDTVAELFAGDDPTAPLRSSRGQGAGHRSEQPRWDLQGVRVLLVEDNAINRQIACELLDIVGVQVATASNGVEALAWLERHSGEGTAPLGRVVADAAAPGEVLPCDVVLMDLNMPEMDGWECTRCIRQHSRWQALPVLAMTAHAMQQERDRCLSLGMQDHLTKPIDPEQLYDCLQHWGGRRRGDGGALGAEPSGSEPRAQARPRISTTLAGLECFDCDGALRRVGGNEELYRRLLKSLLHTQSDAIDQLNQALARQGLAEAEHIVHTIKGVAANLGATALADAAACLDAELKRGKCPKRLKRQFEEQLSLTLQRLRDVFGEGDVDVVPATVAGQNQPLTAKQHQLLQRLGGLIADCDGEVLELIENNREALITVFGSEGHAQLEARLQSFEFSAAQKILQCLGPSSESSAGPKAEP